ncbi:MAG: hypothetical protein ACLSGI_04155 [Butyricicoccaceae bacterium]
MQQIAQFFKVSEEQFVRDWVRLPPRADEAKKVYQNIHRRAARPRALPAMIFAPEALRLFRMRPSLFRPVSAL